MVISPDYVRMEQLLNKSNIAILKNSITFTVSIKIVIVMERSKHDMKIECTAQGATAQVQMRIDELEERLEMSVAAADAQANAESNGSQILRPADDGRFGVRVSISELWERARD